MPLDWIIIIILSLISGLFYRLGGIGDSPHWLHTLFPKWMFDTKIRDLGTPLCGLVILILNMPNFSWPIIGALFLSYGLMFGSMTTYFKRKGQDVKYWNWLLVALAFGISILPYALATHQLLEASIRLGILVLMLPLWCQLIGWDDLEEFGRGLLFVITLGILNLF